jgi:enolase
MYKHIADLVGKSATTLPGPAITVINGETHAGNSLPIQAFPLYMYNYLLEQKFLSTAKKLHTRNFLS